jgi:hypothetical protein
MRKDQLLFKEDVLPLSERVSHLAVRKSIYQAGRQETINQTYIYRS